MAEVISSEVRIQSVAKELNVSWTHLIETLNKKGFQVDSKPTIKISKEMHETLYHFHEPKDEEEANAWLMNFLVRYNAMEHRSEPHSRMEDWLENLPASGVRAACSWERFED
jgi:hypothetical protein